MASMGGDGEREGGEVDRDTQEHTGIHTGSRSQGHLQDATYGVHGGRHLYICGWC